MTPEDSDLLNLFREDALEGEDLIRFQSRVASDRAFAREAMLASAETEMIRSWVAGGQVFPQNRPRSPWRARLLGLGVAMAASVLIAVVHFSGRGRDDKLDEPGATVALKNVREAGCAWSSEAPKPPVVACNREYDLASGTAALTLANGTLLRLDGPARFAFTGDGCLVLPRGQLYCDIPPGAGGLIVTTPDGVVRDIGTRFALEVTPDRASRVHVYEGSVSADISGSHARAELGAGQAASFRAGETEIVPIPLASQLSDGSDWYEPFIADRIPDLAQRGWGNAAVPKPMFELQPDSLSYPGLRRPFGRSVSVPQWCHSPPHDRRLPGRGWFSCLVRIDRVFENQIDAPKAPSLVPMWKFGLSPERNHAIDLNLRFPRAAKDTRSFELGLASEGDQPLWSQQRFSTSVVHLLAFEFRPDRVRCWIDPPADRLGKLPPETPDVELVKSIPPDGLKWSISNLNTGGWISWRLDEVRTGSSWASVTPRDSGEPHR